jgi:hypothetical protein
LGILRIERKSKRNQKKLESAGRERQETKIINAVGSIPRLEKIIASLQGKERKSQ